MNKLELEHKFWLMHLYKMHKWVSDKFYGVRQLGSNIKFTLS